MVASATSSTFRSLAELALVWSLSRISGFSLGFRRIGWPARQNLAYNVHVSPILRITLLYGVRHEHACGTKRAAGLPPALEQRSNSVFEGS